MKNKQKVWIRGVEGRGEEVLNALKALGGKLRLKLDTKKMIVRKGACSAEEGERLIIPMNMRDGSLICVGKGNPDWLFSAPHGAGRLMSRKQAFDTLDLKEYRKEMSGIYSSSVCEETIDESPMVYKPMQEIIDCIEPTVEVKKIIKPIYNFKAKSREIKATEL